MEIYLWTRSLPTKQLSVRQTSRSSAAASFRDSPLRKNLHLPPIWRDRRLDIIIQICFLSHSPHVVTTLLFPVFLLVRVPVVPVGRAIRENIDDIKPWKAHHPASTLWPISVPASVTATASCRRKVYTRISGVRRCEEGPMLFELSFKLVFLAFCCLSSWRIESTFMFIYPSYHISYINT